MTEARMFCPVEGVDRTAQLLNAAQALEFSRVNQI